MQVSYSIEDRHKVKCGVVISVTFQMNFIDPPVKKATDAKL